MLQVTSESLLSQLIILMAFLPQLLLYSFHMVTLNQVNARVELSLWLQK